MSWSEDELFGIPEILPDAGLEKYRAEGLKSFLMEGIKTADGKKTYAYTYFGLPDTPAPAGGYPAVVLVHGGGGSAFPFYANTYRKMGFAVITFDHYGQLPVINPSGQSAYDRPKRPFSPNSWQAASGKFSEGDRTLRHLWLKNAVPLITRANSFLRQQPEINPDNIGVLGISWGSVMSEIALSYDHRFQYAALCYGCGFWSENDPSCGFYNYRDDDFDPRYYLNKVTTPCLWIVGTNDHAFEIAAWQRSWQSAPGTIAASLIVNLDHDHVGWDYEEVIRFVNSFRGKDSALPGIGNTIISDRCASAEIKNPGDGIIRAELNYSCDAKKGSKNQHWQTIPAQINGGTVSAKIPEAAKAVYFNIFDRDYSGKWQFGVSSPVVDLP